MDAHVDNSERTFDRKHGRDYMHLSMIVVRAFFCSFFSFFPRRGEGGEGEGRGRVLFCVYVIMDGCDYALCSWNSTYAWNVK